MFEHPSLQARVQVVRREPQCLHLAAWSTPLQVLEQDVVETMQLLTRRHINMQQLAPDPAAAGPSRQQPLVQLCHAAEEEEGKPPPLQQLLDEAGPEWSRRARHIRACLEEGGACDLCSSVVRVLCVTPCACLLCVTCASLDRERCPQCWQEYYMQARVLDARLVMRLLASLWITMGRVVPVCVWYVARAGAQAGRSIAGAGPDIR